MRVSHDLSDRIAAHLRDVTRLQHILCLLHVAKGRQRQRYCTKEPHGLTGRHRPERRILYGPREVAPRSSADFSYHGHGPSSVRRVEQDAKIDIVRCRQILGDETVAALEVGSNILDDVHY